MFPRSLLIATSVLLGGTVLAQYTCLDMRRGMSAPAFKQAANASRSDSIDILHQRITLDLINSSSTGTIRGNCLIRFTPKVSNIDLLPLDLLDLTVDSVIHSSGALTYTHIGELLTVQLDQAYSPADTLELTVYYQGDPAVDASNFGGFYTTNNYIYNLGVAFDAQPHSFGRAWFPCFDNFVERNTYEFIITTSGGNNAWANGRLLSETNLGGDTLVRHWSLEQTIPSYLAAMAASNYAVVRDTFPSIAGSNIPVTLIAKPGDTTDMKNSFIHLQDSFDKFENGFGPYRWNKVGYALTANGAMEHPTLVSYPDFIADGSLQYETTMAHELGHMWWGDLVTCDRAEEMWINEGFAEYLSYLMLEQVYGYDEYLETVRQNHYRMVRRAHLDDGDQFLALSEVPQDFTYGEHSYNKGADVIHTMRSYLGDSLFYAGLTDFLDSNEFSAVNSLMLRDHLTTVTGVDMTDYFNDWILNPGWASFEVDSFSSVPASGNFDVTVYLEQKLRGAPNLFSNVPVTLTFIDALGATHDEIVSLDGALPAVQVSTPFEPVRIWLNTDDRIGLAVTGLTDTIATTGLRILSRANMLLNVTTITDTTIVRAEQYWVAADDDALEPWTYEVSSDRWWRLSGEMSTGTQMEVRLLMDGRDLVGSDLDPLLIQDVGMVAFDEDSLDVLYRADPSQPWEALTNVTWFNFGVTSDGYAQATVANAQLGDYCFGWRKSAVGVGELLSNDQAEWLISPNPSDGLFTIMLNDNRAIKQVEVIDEQGRIIAASRMNDGPCNVDLSDKPPGSYLIRAIGPTGDVERVGAVVIQ